MYRPWVGVVLSFFITGAAQFLTGRRLPGIAWFVGLWLLGHCAYLVWASPFGGMFAFVLFAVTFGLWMVMLVQSYRPVPRFDGRRWLVFILLFIVLKYGSHLTTDAFIAPFKIPTNSMSPTIRGTTQEPMEPSFMATVFLWNGTLIGSANRNAEILFFSIPKAFSHLRIPKDIS